MVVLGIDPGSITTGWALLKSVGNKIHYVSSGVLSFDKSADFLERLTDIKNQSEKLFLELNPCEIALESLIYVKSPTALIKLAQTRGVILSNIVSEYQGKIFEYSPNLVKSCAVGHGHADKESVRHFLDLLIGKQDYATFDESDAAAVAVCHILHKKNPMKKIKNQRPNPRRSLASSLNHKVGPL